MGQQAWWRLPALRHDEELERERRVSWLELFYDLVFVVVISRLSHHLAAHLDWQGLLGFVLLFLPVWWVWIGGTIYNERFEAEDASHRIFTFLSMLPVAAMAAFSDKGLSDTAVPFALAYIAARLIIIFLWIRGGIAEPLFRPVSTRYVIGFGASVLLWAISIFVDPPWRFVLWGIGLFLDFLTPISTISQQRNLPRMSTSRLPERFGLLVIIVLGESIVGVVNGLADIKITVAAALNTALGMAITFALWWIYFDFVARRPPKVGVTNNMTWSYLHVPLVMSIAAGSAGILHVIQSSDRLVEDSARWLLTGALMMALFCIGLLELFLKHNPNDPTHNVRSTWLKWAGAGLVLVVGVLSAGAPATLFLGLLLLPLLVQMVYGAYIWFSQGEPEQEMAEP
jgi:low temperature requirement protein LtrA